MDSKNIAEYRCNVMGIHSIEDFAGVRGGYHNGIRDVYFARALGAFDNMKTVLLELDKKMGINICAGKLDYYRLSELPKLIKQDDAVFYANAYDCWKTADNGITFRMFEANKELMDIIIRAINKTENLYRKEKKNATNSITRNFLIKIFYWLDHIAGEILNNWDTRRNIKVIAENIFKEQEYLFFYFLTQIGCDVLLLEIEKDIEIPDTLKQMSQVIPVGKYTLDKMPPYKRYTPPKKCEAKNNRLVHPKENVAVSESRNIKIVIPGHKRKKISSIQNNAGISAQQNIANTAITAAPATLDNTARREKTFEELAQLASSIVMITVHNRDGEITGTGSGIMIGKRGYILTNFHVVENGHFFSVRIEDDETVYPTDEIIKYNPVLDLVVIRIEKILNPLQIYTRAEKLVRGQKVVAIGSPLGLFNSVSDGIISGFRTIQNRDMIQFTAPISPGSSGGAVLNMQGEVIGISTSGFEYGQNINLAVSYETILMFANGFFK